MIEYNTRTWSSHLFDVRGSMVREIVGRVSACVGWSLAVVALAILTRFNVAISPTIHTLVGVALGLLLVFRTNASYDRFWEGRRQWGNIINESRNLARSTGAYLFTRSPDLAASIFLWIPPLAHATMNTLRRRTGLGPTAALLSPAEVETALQAPHLPLAVANRLTALLARARDRGAVSDVILASLDANVQQLVDAVGACERIRNTPLPFVYVVHLRRALILYCFTLPFALVSLYGWWTILISLLTSYLFFGIEEIGVEIENPFGHDVNDLPLELFCLTIERDVSWVSAQAASAGGVASEPSV